MDFSALDDAWVKKAPPQHHLTSVRLQRSTAWCAHKAVNDLVAVTHGLVCQETLGVSLANGDVVGAFLDRATFQWSPFTYPQSNAKTLRHTAALGTFAGLRMLLGAPFGAADPSAGVGDGWSPLHHADVAGNEAGVRALLQLRAEPGRRGQCG